MKQTNAFLPVYTADNSAMCSALYELGGLLVMHDASGCNSTYTTHDEPRWESGPAHAFISGLIEVDAVLGNEKRVVDDICEAAASFRPNFICLAGTPIPMMMGTDYDGIAREIEARSGIPAFGVDTNGTEDYSLGAGKAFAGLADRFCTERLPKTERLSVNLLGVTPLDFSVNGNHRDLKALFEAEGIRVNACFAMDGTLDSIKRASAARVNVAVTGAGIPAAKLLLRRFGTPFVIGCPVGEFMAGALLSAVRAAAKDGESRNLAVGARGNAADGKPVYVIGEPVIACAARAALVRERGMTNVRVLTALAADKMLLAPGDRAEVREDDFLELLPGAALVLGDPMHRALLRLRGLDDVPFAEWPHTALSGRIWERAMPRFIGNRFSAWLDEALERPSLVLSDYPARS